MSQPDLSRDNVQPVSSASFSVGPSENQFIDRRAPQQAEGQGKNERRQFGSSHAGLSDDGRELALAIDHYKVTQHRRYLTCDEMLTVLRNLGYSKQTAS